MPARFVIIRHKEGHADRIVSTSNDYGQNEEWCGRLNALAGEDTTFSTADWDFAEQHDLAY